MDILFTDSLVSQQNPSQSQYSTLTLKVDPGSEPIRLSRHSSFPARQYDFKKTRFIPKSNWPATLTPLNGADLSLELGEFIGGGRSAVVYSVNVLATEPRGESNPPTVTLRSPELCIKVARPNHCRTLAREAWVYERLAEGVQQGVNVPRCYGFFTTELRPEQLPFPLWLGEEYDEGVTPEDIDSDDPTQDDSLPDDNDPYNQAGHSGPREHSSWVEWRPEATKPLLSVLVMARGGEIYTHEDHEDDSTR